MGGTREERREARGTEERSSDVNRGQNLETEAGAKTSRPRLRPEVRGRGQFLQFMPRPRPKIIMKKVPNND